MAHQRKYVIAVDDSPVSKDTVTWAAKDLLGKGDEITLVSVLEPAAGASFMTSETPSFPADATEACVPDPVHLERTQATLKTFKSDLEKQGFKDVKMTTLVSCVGGSADAARHIVEYADRKNPTMVIMGSRGMGAGKRAMLGLFGLGSVSDYVVRHAPCNVVVHKSLPGEHK